MIKKLHFKKLLLMALMLVGAGSAWADDVYYTLDGTVTGGSNGYAEESAITQGDITWEVMGNTMMNPWRIGGKSLDKVDRPIYSTTAMGAAITEVKLEVGAASNITVNSLKLYVADNANFTDASEISADFEASSTISFKPASGNSWAKDSYYKIVFNVSVTGNSNRFLEFKKADFYGSGGSATVAKPTFDPAGGTYTTAQSVTISCTTQGATIHYTTNGEDPTETDAAYSSAISVTKSGTTIKAKAFKSGMTASSVASATYVIKPSKPTVTAAGATVTITGDDGCTFYYTTDGEVPTTSSTKYTAPFNLSADCTIKARAYDANDNASDVTSFTYKYFPLSPKNVNSNYYVKVTDASTLENGDAILIVCEKDGVAMSTTQNGNNRGQAVVAVIGDVINSPSEDVQKLVLVNKAEKLGDDNTETEVFYFYTGSGYLYAPSSNSNYLRTETTPDNNNNARATISVTNGDATITFTGSSSRNQVKHNKSNKLFSCYDPEDKNQEIVQIYKEVTAPTSVPVTIGSAGFATFACASNLDYTTVTALKAYSATVDGTTISFNKETKVPAGEGVLLQGAAGTYNVPVASSVTTWAEDYNAFIRGTGAAVQTGDGPYNYILNVVNNVVGFYKAAGQIVANNRAYLQSTEADARILMPSSETTGIENVNANLNNSRYFDLQGRQVAQPTKGLYIVNGKKVLVK